MNSELTNTALLGAAFSMLFAFAELLYHKFKVQAEYSRKVVHIGTGLLTLLFPILLNSHWSVLFLCASFLGILILSLKFKLLPSINAIDRKSYGSIGYPIIVFICFLLWEKIEKPIASDSVTYTFFYLPILIMALADPAAALVGKAKPIGIFKFGNEKKSFSGSFAFFIVAFIISLLFLLPMAEKSIFIKICLAGIIAIISTLTELFSSKGLDNFTIPLSVLGSLYVLIILL